MVAGAQNGFRSGFVAVVGRPNVGKSTFLNRVLGQKVTIVSDKPQTTRNRIQCVWTTPTSQVVFLDTPGIHRPHDRLGENMVQAALDALQEVEGILFFVDAAAGIGKGDRYIAARLTGLETPVILVVNKVDAIMAKGGGVAAAPFASLGEFRAVHEISAATGKGVDKLCERLIELLPPGPKYYPEDWVSDHPEQFVVAELVREKVLQLTHEEVPHATAVQVERMTEDDDRGLIEIEATVFVDRESQKGIIIGKGGARLKEIGTLARHDIEKLLGSRVFLRLWVKVKRDWRDKESVLRSLGYS